MFLSRFRVRGYKCLEDVDIALTPIHVLIGRSDSGKTSLLEAISAFCGRLKTPPAQWFPAVADGRELLTHGSSVPTIDLAGQWAEMPPAGGPPLPVAGYGYSVVVPASGLNFGILDQWVRPRSDKDPQSGLARVAIAFPQRAGPAKAEDRAARATFRDAVQKMLEPAPLYRLDPRRLAEPADIDPSSSGLMAADGHGLPVLLDEIARRHPEKFAEIEADFCRLAPQYHGLGVLSAPSLTKKKSRRTPRPDTAEPTTQRLVFETCSGRNLVAREVSAGSLILLTMLTLTHLPAPPTMLLIENLEHGLHPQWLGAVIGVLKQAVAQPEGRQFPQVIVSTHSPAVLNFFQPEEVTLLVRPEDKPDGPTMARPLQGMEAIRDQVAGGKARLGELWSEFER